MRTNLFAYTETIPTDGYVGYVSLNQEEDGSVTMAVRSPGNGGSHLACLKLPPDVRAKLGATLLRDELERLDSTVG